MGFGTVWKLGKPADARLWWEDRFPEGRLEVYLKFVGQPDLEELRDLLHGSKLKPTDLLPVYETEGFPSSHDPEWESWYQNINQESTKYIHKITPEFLEELARVSPDQLDALDAAWGFPRVFLEEMTQFARVAIAQNMVGFAREIF